jgi:hypothetical protein
MARMTYLWDDAGTEEPFMRWEVLRIPGLYTPPAGFASNIGRLPRPLRR